MDSGPEETPGTSEEERLMPGPSEVPSGTFDNVARADASLIPSVDMSRRRSVPSDSTVFRAPVPLSAAARHALTRTASPTPRDASPVFMQAPTSPDPQSDEDSGDTGFVDADAPTAKPVPALWRAVVCSSTLGRCSCVCPDGGIHH